jgi:3-phosphoshikimate 1-carboxyvinyltransferase
MKELSGHFSYCEIDIPSSKSYINRALIIASIKKEPVKIKNISYPQDVQDLLLNLEDLGLEIEREEDGVVIKNSFPECEKNRRKDFFHLGEGGTSSRFFLSLIARGKEKYKLDVHERLAKRPIQPLIDSLKNAGARFYSEAYPLEVQGPLKPGNIEVDCKESTQFASSLKLGTFDLGMKVKVNNLTTSKYYLEMTEQVISEMKSSDEYTVPVDFSSLANYVALGMTHEGIKIRNCFRIDPFQGDSQLFGIINSMGGEFKFDESGLIINPLVLKPFEWDCEHCLDLVPVLCFLAAKAKGTTKLRNIHNLTYKESNRLKEVQIILKEFGVDSDYDISSDTLSIHGSGEVQNIPEITPFEDHRLVMMASLLMIASGGGKIHNETAVNKSFPEFFDYL